MSVPCPPLTLLHDANRFHCISGHEDEHIRIDLESKSKHGRPPNRRTCPSGRLPDTQRQPAGLTAAPQDTYVLVHTAITEQDDDEVHEEASVARPRRDEQEHHREKRRHGTHDKGNGLRPHDCEEAVEEQDRLIEEGYFDYIITYYDGYDWDNYELVAVSDDDYSDYTKELFVVRYCIYQRVDG